jgi:hypothetical protein
MLVKLGNSESVTRDDSKSRPIIYYIQDVFGPLKSEFEIEVQELKE